MKNLFRQDSLHILTKKSTNLRVRSIPPNCTVLIVEDDASNYVQLSQMLGSMGIFCEWKISGYELGEFANSLPHLNLILLDIHLPYDDGYSALNSLHNSERLKEIPLIAMAFEGFNFPEEKFRGSNFEIGRASCRERVSLEV
jgi:two-component system cell cycle response regulator DivK